MRNIYAVRGRGTSGDVGQQLQAETHMIGITMEREGVRERTEQKVNQ